MAAMTNLLIKDDTVTTPVEFTFLPVTDTPNPVWRTSIAAVPIAGQHRLTLEYVAQKNGGYKLSSKLEACVLETLGASGTSAGYVAPPKVAYVTTGIFSMFVDARSTSQDRANCLKMLLGWLSGASSTTATGILNQASAGNAFVNSVLPGPAFYTALNLPN
jgi:hypothetical protein